MIAVDTNVVVRLLTADDKRQYAAAKALFASEPIWISKTVLLETGWVLLRLYQLPPDEVRDALRRLLGLVNVESEDKASILKALALTEAGLDLADALHLKSRPSGTTFASFDQAFVRRAKRAGAPDVIAVPVPSSR